MRMTAIALAALACGSTPPLPTAPAEDLTLGSEPWRVALISQHSRLFIYAGETAEGGTAIVNESSRVVAHGAALEWAPMRPLVPIVAAQRMGDGWYFLLRDGNVLRAGDFLGPLEPIDRGRPLAARRSRPPHRRVDRPGRIARARVHGPSDPAAVALEADREGPWLASSP